MMVGTDSTSLLFSPIAFAFLTYPAFSIQSFSFPTYFSSKHYQQQRTQQLQQKHESSSVLLPGETQKLKLLGTSILDFIHPDDHAHFKERANEKSQAEEPLVSNVRYLKSQLAMDEILNESTVDQEWIPLKIVLIFTNVESAILVLFSDLVSAQYAQLTYHWKTDDFMLDLARSCASVCTNMIPDANSRASVKLKNILVDENQSEEPKHNRFVVVLDALNFRLLAATPQSFLSAICTVTKIDNPFGHFDFMRYWMSTNDYMKLRTLIEKFRFEPAAVKKALGTPDDYFSVRLLSFSHQALGFLTNSLNAKYAWYDTSIIFIGDLIFFHSVLAKVTPVTVSEPTSPMVYSVPQSAVSMQSESQFSRSSLSTNQNPPLSTKKNPQYPAQVPEVVKSATISGYPTAIQSSNYTFIPVADRYRRSVTEDGYSTHQPNPEVIASLNAKLAISRQTTDVSSMSYPESQASHSPDGSHDERFETAKMNFSKRGRSRFSPNPLTRHCSSCGSAETPEWRKSSDKTRTLCNACGIRLSRLKSRTNSTETISEHQQQLHLQNLTVSGNIRPPQQTVYQQNYAYESQRPAHFYPINTSRYEPYGAAPPRHSFGTPMQFPPQVDFQPRMMPQQYINHQPQQFQIQLPQLQMQSSSSFQAGANQYQPPVPGQSAYLPRLQIP